MRLEAEYELLFTNRLILQPLVEAEIYGKAIPNRRIGAGENSIEPGLRLRYGLRRDVAPYVGVTWPMLFGAAADAARAAGEPDGGARFIAGMRAFL